MIEYEPIKLCNYPVQDKIGEYGCGEPAVYRVWWYGDDCDDEMFVCFKCLQKMQEREGFKRDELNRELNRQLSNQVYLNYMKGSS